MHTPRQDEQLLLSQNEARGYPVIPITLRIPYVKVGDLHT